MAFSDGSEGKGTLSDEHPRGVCAFSLLLCRRKKPLVNSCEESKLKKYIITNAFGEGLELILSIGILLYGSLSV
jgi:hypothetical protein